MQNLGGLVSKLTQRRIQPRCGAHLDPDLLADSLPRKRDWRPLFGQRGAALGHLQRQGIGLGDLFLFYGWFRQTEWVKGHLRYVANAPDLHVIFGWLQVGDIWDVTKGETAFPAWAGYHPHLQGVFRDENGSGQNAIYVAAQEMDPWFGLTNLSGGGLFSEFHPSLQLSEGSRLRSQWLLPSWFLPKEERPPLTYHGSTNRWHVVPDGVLLRTVGRGQEFVLNVDAYPESKSWLREILSRSK